MQKSSIRKFFRRIKNEAVRRPQTVVSMAMGAKKHFHAYDLGDDTVVFERSVWKHMDEHASVLVVEKNDLAPGAFGHLITVTDGNHSVAAIPLLMGKFWDLCDLDGEMRSEAMTHCVLTANVVDGKLEISQRDVPCAKLVRLDDWLINKLGLSLSDVVMAERNDETLQHFRELGQEWRVKPLAWTDAEIRAAVSKSRKKISSSITYYHSVKGVHFLTWPEFHRLADLARRDFDGFKAALAELADVYEGNETSFMRQAKFHGHHEIELFGVVRGNALDKIVPRLEELYADIQTEPDRALGRIAEIDIQFRALLARPEFADESSPEFAEALYMHLTGEVYSVSGDGTTPAFDDRRTALPGATFINGAPIYHPGVDERTEMLLSNVRHTMSKDEFIEYANVYELRTRNPEQGDMHRLGEGKTREIVFKTNCRPLVSAFVEKRLSRSDSGYGAYVLARVEGFKSIGLKLPEYRLLRHRAFGRRSLPYDYYIRTRCEGEPIDSIPAHMLADAQARARLAFLMGDAAAQNMVMKKYDHELKSALYGIGKEIYRFAWNVDMGRVMPRSVYTCSLRGSCGWPDITCSEANFRKAAKFYIGEYAHAFAKWLEECKAVPSERLSLLAKFAEGFESRTKALAWRYTRQREELIKFSPPIPESFCFLEKGLFIMKSLLWQAAHLDEIRDEFVKLAGSSDRCSSTR